MSCFLTCLHNNQQIAGLNDDNNQRVVITARHHPLYGQSVKVIRKIRRRGEVHFVIEMPNGQTQELALRYTEIVNPSASMKNSQLFTANSLRELVKMVKAIKNQQLEACDETNNTLRNMEQPCSPNPSGVSGSISRIITSPDPSPAVASSKRRHQ